MASGEKKPIAVVVPDVVREALTELAKSRAESTGKRTYVSDIAREAIREYLERHGYPGIDTDVDRGGNRRASKDAP